MSNSYVLFLFHSYPAVHRRRSRRSRDDTEHEPIHWRYIMNLIPFKILSLDESLANNTLQPQDSVSGDSPVDYHDHLTYSADALIDSEEHQVSPTVSVKKVTQFELANMTNIQQLNESKVEDRDNLQNESINPPSTANVIRVKRMSNFNSTIRRRISRATSRRMARVKITKILRKISSRNQRSRSVSFISINQSAPDAHRGVTVRRVSRATLNS